MVPIAPGGGEGVGPDEVDVLEPGLLGGEGRRGVEPARHAGLAAAERARAEPAQVMGEIGRAVAVLPVQLERAGGPIGMDAGRDGSSRVGLDGHGPILRRKAVARQLPPNELQAAADGTID